MNTFSLRLTRVLVFVFALLFFLQSSYARAESEVIASPNASSVAFFPYAPKGKGTWEAECATHSSVSAWTFRKAARASKADVDCNPSGYANKNYIEASATSSKVCLDFLGADRVGVGYVAGNYKGKATVIVTDANGVQLNASTGLDTYVNYAYTETTGAGLSAQSFDPEFEEGDLDSSGASDASQTFHAFKWVWEQNDTAPNKDGKICVNPKNAKNAASKGVTVSIDYFVVARGAPMAVRGVATGVTNLTQADVNATWNYDMRNFRLPSGAQAPQNPFVLPNPNNWKGFIPKLSGVTSNVSYDLALYIIDQTDARSSPGTHDNVPKYWIQFNEEDHAPHFANGTQPTPYDSGLLDGFISNIKNVRDAYMEREIPQPKFIVDTGSQLHAPPGNGTWGYLENCAPYNQNWGCQFPNKVWIDEFWRGENKESGAKLRLVQEGLMSFIGGFGGHFYQNNNQNCNLGPTAKCRLQTTQVTDFAAALQTWTLTNSGVPNPEIWLIEIGTSLNGFCGKQGFVNEQADLQKCVEGTKTITLNVRNYVGALQNELGKQGIVHRWAWFADRYGTKLPCTPDDPDTPQNEGVDGQETALNAECTQGLTLPALSPYGHNYKLIAPYR